MPQFSETGKMAPIPEPRPRRISIVPTDPGYTKDGYWWSITLNGLLAYFVQTANEEEGWIEYLSYPGGPCGEFWKTRMDEAGKPISQKVDIDPITGSPLTVRIHGIVKLTHFSELPINQV